MGENRKENSINTGKDPKTGQFLPGNKLTPLDKVGRPAGTRDFATDFDEVVKDIAKENNLTVSDVRKVLLKQAYKQAKDGNYSFYKDIHDRVYGQATQKQEIKADVEITGGLTPDEKEKLLNLLK